MVESDLAFFLSLKKKMALGVKLSSVSTQPSALRNPCSRSKMFVEWVEEWIVSHMEDISFRTFWQTSEIKSLYSKWNSQILFIANLQWLILNSHCRLIQNTYTNSPGPLHWWVICRTSEMPRASQLPFPPLWWYTEEKAGVPTPQQENEGPISDVTPFDDPCKMN